MYSYVDDKIFLKRAQKVCSKIVKTLEEKLRNEEDMNTQVFLVGSGARNMITQNEDEKIDFDYNINVLSTTDWNERSIKETIRKVFNKVLQSYNLRDCEDSTSSLTTKTIYFEDEPDIEFSMDIAIVTKNENGKWERLIHQKTGYVLVDKYFWNLIPNSNGYEKKAKNIKNVPGCWEEVRKQYLNIKNHYLLKNDNNHPSFVCYIEAVNNVYNTMKQRGLL